MYVCNILLRDKIKNLEKFKKRINIGCILYIYILCMCMIMLSNKYINE